MEPPSPVDESEKVLDSKLPSHQFPMQPAVAPTVKKTVNWKVLILVNILYLAFSWLTAVTRQAQLNMRKEEEKKKEEEKESTKQKKSKKKHKKSKRQKKRSVE